MAKYTRFDPRNKKRGKHKAGSLEKDIRIREVVDNKDRYQMLREVVYNDDDQFPDEPEFLQE